MSASQMFLHTMDHDDHFQSLSFCNKLYNFFMKTLLDYALKPVILGRPMHQNLHCEVQNGTTHEADQTLRSQTQTSSREDNQETKNTTSSSMIENDEGCVGEDRTCDHEKRPEEEAAMPSVVLQKKAPKKVVSINEIVEEIPRSKKRLRKKKSADKLSSFEFQEEDDSRLLKSILKVGSNLGDKSNSFVSPTNDG